MHPQKEDHPTISCANLTRAILSKPVRFVASLSFTLGAHVGQTPKGYLAEHRHIGEWMLTYPSPKERSHWH